MEHQEMPVSCGGDGQQQWKQWDSEQEAECEVLAWAWAGPGGGHCGQPPHPQHSRHPHQVRSSSHNPGIMRTTWQAWYLPAYPWSLHLQLTLPDFYSDSNSGIYDGISYHKTCFGILIWHLEPQKMAKNMDFWKVKNTPFNNIRGISFLWKQVVKNHGSCICYANIWEKNCLNWLVQKSFYKVLCLSPITRTCAKYFRPKLKIFYFNYDTLINPMEYYDCSCWIDKVESVLQYTVIWWIFKMFVKMK